MTDDVTTYQLGRGGYGATSKRWRIAAHGPTPEAATTGLTRIVTICERLSGLEVCPTCSGTGKVKRERQPASNETPT